MYLKPKYFANLNRNHRHAKDMTFCSLMNENTGLQTWDFIGRNSYEFDGTYTPDWNVGGVEFNANREHINGPALNSVLGYRASGSILFKYKITNDPSSYRYFFAVGDTYTTFSAYASVDGTSFNVVIDNDTFSWSGLSLTSASVIGLTFYWEGALTYVSLYVDGFFVSTQTASTSLQDSSDLFNIGGRTDSDGRYVGGTIDWFYIWDKVLSDTEAFQVSNDPYAMFEDTEVVPVLHVAGAVGAVPFGGLYGKALSGSLGGRGV